MNDYPSLTPDKDEDAKELLRIITRERPIDIKDFDNLKNRFMSGRKVGKVPTGANDTTPSDKVGDFNIAEDGGFFYFYTLVDDSGTAKWGRVVLDTSW